VCKNYISKGCVVKKILFFIFTILTTNCISCAAKDQVKIYTKNNDEIIINGKDTHIYTQDNAFIPSENNYNSKKKQDIMTNQKSCKELLNMDRSLMKAYLFMISDADLLKELERRLKMKK
jgi:hypothetical protein